MDDLTKPRSTPEADPCKSNLYIHEELDLFLAAVRDHVDRMVTKQPDLVPFDSRIYAGIARLAEEFCREIKLRDADAEDLKEISQSLQGIPSIEACLAAVGTESGAQRLSEYLSKKPYPHFETDPGNPRLLIRVSEDGTRTKGQFVDRVFVEQE